MALGQFLIFLIPIGEAPFLTEDGWGLKDDVVYPLSVEELIQKISVVFPKIKKTDFPGYVELVDGGMEFGIYTDKIPNRIIEVSGRLDVFKYPEGRFLGVINKIFELAETVNLAVFDTKTGQVAPSREIFNQSLVKYLQRIQ